MARYGARRGKQRGVEGGVPSFFGQPLRTHSIPRTRSGWLAALLTSMSFIRWVHPCSHCQCAQRKIRQSHRYSNVQQMHTTGVSNPHTDTYHQFRAHVLTPARNLPFAHFGSLLPRIGSLVLKNKELPMLILSHCGQLPVLADKRPKNTIKRWINALKEENTIYYKFVKPQ